MARTVGRSSSTSSAVRVGAGPEAVSMTLRVNQQTYQLSSEPCTSLLDVLRIRLGFTGAKRVCNLGECGACTVLLDGRAIYSCIALAVECQGQEILTIEGLSADGSLDPVQEAFIRHDAVQCGYCTPGQVLAAKALLRERPVPTEAEIRHAMAGNLCRCGTYPRLVSAIRDVAAGGRDAGPGRRGVKTIVEPGTSRGGESTVEETLR